jgi:hypothetical protein
MTRWVVFLVLLLAAPAAAAAREPVISYVDENEVFRLYDEQTEAEVEPPPPVPVAAGFQYGMSLDGRYIAFTDASKNIHLLDRATNTELPLPGIDVHANPQNLTVSNTGLIAFDQNVEGSAVVYDSVAKSFIDTGLPDPNGHRQTRLSGDGRFLATTCMAQCMVDTGGGTEAFVQDLTAKTDTAFPFDTTRDEEHVCLNGDGSFLGFDKAAGGMIVKKNIFLFDRSESPPAAVALGTGVNDNAEDEVYCVLDSSGDHLGLMNDFATFQVYEQSNSKFLELPPDKEFDRYSLFSDPYTPPPPQPPPACCGPPPDVTKPVARRFRITHRRFRPHRGATKFRFTLSEPADVRIRFKRRGRSVGALKRRHLEAGANAITFSGRLRGHRLRAGRYVAVLTATDAAGNRSRARSIRFTVLPAGGDGRR